MTKVGLIAPFEGLYRRTGYAALAAMRSALDDAGASEIAIVPLAVDDLNDPERARRSAQKMLADPSVIAVIGPLAPWTVASVAPVMGAAPTWIVPYAITPDAGFVNPSTTDAWAEAWVAEVAAVAQGAGHQRLVLAGWQEGWPTYTAQQWASVAAMPVIVADDPALVEANDAVLWLGSAGEGAAYLTALRAVQPAASLWLGMQGADPVFRERACPSNQAAEAPCVIENVYWTMWTPIEYNPAVAPNLPGEPDAQLVYFATRAALHRTTALSTSESSSDSSLALFPDSANWQLQLFELSSGESVPAPGLK